MLSELFWRPLRNAIGLFCLLGYSALASAATVDEERPYLCQSNPTDSIHKAVCSDKDLSKQAWLLEWELEESAEAAGAANPAVLEAIKQANGAWEESLPTKCPDDADIVPCLKRTHLVMSQALADLMTNGGLKPSPTHALHLAAAGAQAPELQSAATAAAAVAPPQAAAPQPELAPAPAPPAMAKEPATIAAAALAAPLASPASKLSVMIGLVAFALVAALLVTRRIKRGANQFPTEPGTVESAPLSARAPRPVTVRAARSEPAPAPVPPLADASPSQSAQPAAQAERFPALSADRRLKLAAGLALVLVVGAASWQAKKSGVSPGEQVAETQDNSDAVTKVDTPSDARRAQDASAARESCLAQIRAKHGSYSTSTGGLTAGLVAQARDAAACQDSGSVTTEPVPGASSYANRANERYLQFASAFEASPNQICQGAGRQVRMMAERGADDVSVISAIGRAKAMGCLDHAIPREEEIAGFRRAVASMQANRNFRCQARGRQLAAELARVEGGFERRNFRYLVEQANRDGCF